MSSSISIALYGLVSANNILPSTTLLSQTAKVSWSVARRYLLSLNDGQSISVSWVLQFLDPNDSKEDPVVRQEISAMSEEDSSRFFDAIDTMLINKSGRGTSEFFRLASYHGFPEPIYCHHGQETFPGWHRIYLMRFEQALQVADRANGKDGKIGLPYWDWTTNFRNGLPPIIRKRFSRWPRDLFPRGVRPPAPLRRASDAAIAMGINSGVADAAFDSLRATQHWAHASTASFSNLYPSVEEPHNTMHVVVGGRGGTMTSVSWAAYDIVFWLHHCNVDRIYESYLVIEPDSAQEFENFQETQFPDLFEIDFTPFYNGKAARYYKAKDTFDTRALGYEYATLMKARPLRLREPPTLCFLPKIKVSDYDSKCYTVFMFIVDAAKEEDWEELEVEEDIDYKSDNFVGVKGIFGRGKECATCVSAAPYDLIFDITKTIRKLGISRYNAKPKVYVLDSTRNSPILWGLDETRLPQPIISGPLFEDKQSDLNDKNSNKNEVKQLQRYLSRFGYYSTKYVADGVYGVNTIQAVKDYQEASGLKVTGIVDAATKKSMVEKKRCSNIDPFAKNDEIDADSIGTCFGGRKKLSYFIGTHPGYMPRVDVENAIDSAVKVWSEACGLSFVQVEDNYQKEGPKTDIKFSWESGGRGDDVLAFDGVGGVLAHGGTDEKGENGFVEFDSAERWICGLNDGDDLKLSVLSDTTTWYRGQPIISLYYTALHEMGHALGLVHTASSQDVMGPYYTPLLKKLSKNDISRIQAMYGAPNVN